MQNTAEIIDFSPYPRTALASKPKEPVKYFVTVVFQLDSEVPWDIPLGIHCIFFDEKKAIKYVSEYGEYYDLSWETHQVQE